MSEINMTPLIDVMLVLLVIFMLAAPLLVSSVKLELPASEAARPRAPAPSVEVTLDASGQLWLRAQAVSPEVLRQHLREAARQDPQTEVQLRADAAVPHGRVVALMGLAQAAGLRRIAFVAEPLEAR